MSLLNFPQDSVVKLERTAELGGKTKDFKASGWWDWFNETILMSIEHKALMTLRTAKSEQDRMMAQQMSVVPHEIRRVVNGLVTQGEGAVEQLKTISTLKEKEDEQTSRQT
jgi:hypothetical protein